MKKKAKKAKKTKRNKKVTKSSSGSKKIKKFKKISKKRKKIYKAKLIKGKRKKSRKILKKLTHIELKKVKKESLILKLVKLQLSLKPELNFKINLNLEKYIQGFFDKISETISNYKILKSDEKRRLKLEKIENERKAKIAIEKQKKRGRSLKN